MNPTAGTLPEPKASNIVTLAIAEKPKRGGFIKAYPFAPPAAPRKERFKIIEFINASGTKSWRVSGTNPKGKQVRKNFLEPRAAEAEKLKQETEFLSAPAGVQQLQATHLSPDQIKIAESVFARVDDPNDLIVAVVHWQRHGKPHAAVESARLDEAFKQFNEWLDATPTLRARTKGNLRVRVNVFANATANFPVNEITADMIETHLDSRNVSATSKDNDRRALSRFFGWCMERPRHWLAINPCAAVRIEQGEQAAPEILTVAECRKLIRAAEKLKAGKLVPYVAVTMFGGLRPTEASKLTWELVNLKDGEIRLDGIATKTGRPRVITIGSTLQEWLTAYKGKPFYPPGWRKDFDKIKLAIGSGTATKEKPKLKSWTPDILRHTAISHHFRRTGSYGQCAEMFGNSEAIIKRHYQGRVSTEETTKFYALKPTGKAKS